MELQGLWMHLRGMHSDERSFKAMLTVRNSFALWKKRNQSCLRVMFYCSISEDVKYNKRDCDFSSWTESISFYSSKKRLFSVKKTIFTNLVSPLTKLNSLDLSGNSIIRNYVTQLIPKNWNDESNVVRLFIVFMWTMHNNDTNQTFFYINTTSGVYILLSELEIIMKVPKWWCI